MDREAWRAVVHGVTKSWTRLSQWTELNASKPLLCLLVDALHPWTLGPLNSWIQSRKDEKQILFGKIMMDYSLLHPIGYYKCLPCILAMPLSVHMLFDSLRHLPPPARQMHIRWSSEPTHWKRPWSWERLEARGEGDDKGWVGWMTSPTQWTWVCSNSRR